MPYHEEFGMQLAGGPLLLDVCGNPLGLAGMRQVQRQEGGEGGHSSQG